MPPAPVIFASAYAKRARTPTKGTSKNKFIATCTVG